MAHVWHKTWHIIIWNWGILNQHFNPTMLHYTQKHVIHCTIYTIYAVYYSNLFCYSHVSVFRHTTHSVHTVHDLTLRENSELSQSYLRVNVDRDLTQSVEQKCWYNSQKHSTGKKSPGGTLRGISRHLEHRPGPPKKILF